MHHLLKKIKLISFLVVTSFVYSSQYICQDFDSSSYITFTSLHTHTNIQFNSSGKSVLLPTILKTILVVRRPG